MQVGKVGLPPLKLLNVELAMNRATCKTTTLNLHRTNSNSDNAGWEGWFTPAQVAEHGTRDESSNVQDNNTQSSSR